MDHFVISEKDYFAEENEKLRKKLRTRAMPVLVQSFNRYVVLFNNKIYEYPDVFTTVAVMLSILTLKFENEKVAQLTVQFINELELTKSTCLSLPDLKAKYFGTTGVDNQRRKSTESGQQKKTEAAEDFNIKSNKNTLQEERAEKSSTYIQQKKYQ
jgi:hypothetical protein